MKGMQEFQLWTEPENFRKYTSVIYGDAAYAFPLNHIMSALQARTVRRRATDLAGRTPEAVRAQPLPSTSNSSACSFLRTRKTR